MKRNIKVYTTLIIISVFFMVLPIESYADEDIKSNVNISIISEKNTYSPIIDCEVKVIYNDKNLYNHGQFLSYHIYDSSNNVLNFEGERIPLNLDNKMNLKIDLSKYIDLKSINEARIEFDIIDQNEAYWMSTNSNVELKAEEIKYEKNEFKRITNMYKKQFLENKIVVLINIMTCVLVIIFFIKRKNKNGKQKTM